MHRCSAASGSGSRTAPRACSTAIGSAATSRPPTWRCGSAGDAARSRKASPWRREAPTRRSDPHEVLRLDGLTQAVEVLVDLVPARQLLHVGEPAPYIGIGREIAADELAERDDPGAEIVRDGDLITAQILPVRPDPMVIEQLEPFLRIRLDCFEHCGLSLVAASLQVREQLRIGKIVAPDAIEVGVDPIHHLVDLSALLEI